MASKNFKKIKITEIDDLDRVTFFFNQREIGYTTKANLLLMNKSKIKGKNFDYTPIMGWKIFGKDMNFFPYMGRLCFEYIIKSDSEFVVKVDKDGVRIEATAKILRTDEELFNFVIIGTRCFSTLMINRR